MGTNPVASGFASSRAGKTTILERTKVLIDTSELIVTMPFDSTTVEQIDMLRKSLPEGTKASVVKNSLMKIAVKDTAFSSIADQEDLRRSNIFFFIPEGEAKPTFKAFKAWKKEANKKDLEPKFGIMEGIVFRGERLEAVANLPTKLELITKIAQGIKAVPTKVGRGISAVPNKLGRAFGALKDKIAEGEGEEE
jgi:large subunit ribosomal protein L10